MNNDPKLKLAMARLLPEYIEQINGNFEWIDPTEGHFKVYETEWLYVMHLVEQTLDNIQRSQYADTLCNDYVYANDPDIESIISLTFNQRATAMCRVKGIEC